MVDKNKEFVEMVLKRSEEKFDKKAKPKSPFHNLVQEEIEDLTKELMEKKPKK